MRILPILYCISFVIHCFSFLHNFSYQLLLPKMGVQNPTIQPIYNIYNIQKQNHLTMSMERKTDNIALLKMIRPSNIIPTFMLSFMGGWIVNPDIKLLLAKRFWISAIITQLVMSGSMVINDIYDIDVDRKNNPLRPLPSGKVSIQSASIFTGILFLSAIILGHIHFANTKLPIIISTSVCMLIMYTPIFKRMCFIKNLVCATIVSGSIAFSGLAIGLKNPLLLSSIVRLVAASSIHMEILNDIRDYKGDREAKILTIPVVFGKMAAGIFAKLVLYIGVIDAIITSFCYPFSVTIGIIIACYLMIRNIIVCEMCGFSKNTIKKATNGTTISLFLNMLIFCYAATVVL